MTKDETLAQPKQEPVAWRYRGNLHEFDPSDWATGPVTPLYTAPPQRPWVGLTDEEFKKMVDDAGFTRTDLLMIGDCVEQLADLVEAKLKEKNT